MSWHGPSAPRVEGIATKSRVVAICASKLASTASRIFCLVSLAFIASWFPWATASTGRCDCDQTTHYPDFQGFLLAFRIAAAPIDCAEIPRPRGPSMPNTRNLLFLVIGALIVAVGVLGYK